MHEGRQKKGGREGTEEGSGKMERERKKRGEKKRVSIEEMDGGKGREK